MLVRVAVEAWPQAGASGRGTEGRVDGMGQREVLGGRGCRCRSQGRAGCREQSRVHKGCVCYYRSIQKALDCLKPEKDVLWREVSRFAF